MPKRIDENEIKNLPLWNLMRNNGITEVLDLADRIYCLIDWYNPGDKDNTDSTSDDYKAYYKNRDKLRKKITRDLHDPSNMNYERLRAYCSFFKCSADYLLGFIGLPTKEKTDINKSTGLSEDSIITLQKKHTHEKEVKLMLNFLLGKQPERGCNLLFLMYHYLFGNYNKIRGLNDWSINFMDDMNFNGVAIEISEINSVFKSMVESQIQKIKAFVDSSEELHDYGKFIPSEDECKNTIINCNNEIERAKREMRKGINREFWEKRIEAQRAVITRYENVLNIKYGQ